jgi:alpha-methylacyl-CoA racemase
MTGGPAAGPLHGTTVIEMAGLGPAPLCGLMLAEMGARVLRIERMNEKPFLALDDEFDYTRHGRSVIKVDLKDRRGTDLVFDLAQSADILIEGFRPGVMERLGLGPEQMLERNPRLIYGRVTGFGQDGPLAQRAGHDLTYLAYSGILHAIGHKGARPTPPLNLVGDYGGGTMFLISGVLAALIERGRSGKGQVVDAAMIDGALMLSLQLFAFMSAGKWQDRPASNLLDSGCPFYDTYETKDGLYMAVACLEPQFFAEFARLLPLDQRFVAGQYDRTLWPELRDAIAAGIRRQTRAAWAELFTPTDACVAPVLSFAEAQRHPHNKARGTHVQTARLTRPAPAPRLSRTALSAVTTPHKESAADILTAFGIANGAEIISDGVVG